MSRLAVRIGVLALAVLLAVPAAARVVELGSRTLSGAGFDPDLQGAIDAMAPPDRLHAILRFARPLSRRDHARLRVRGVRLLTYLPKNGYTASIPGGIQPTDPVFRTLFGADPIRPEDKISPRLRCPAPPSWVLDPDGRVHAIVEFHADVDPALARRALQQLSLDPSKRVSRTFQVTLSRADLQRLAAADIVRRIDAGPLPFLPLNDRGRIATGTETAQDMQPGPGRPTFALDGEGVKIGIFDEGIFALHLDMAALEPDGSLGASRVLHPEAASKHGTHVASIAAGSGVASVESGWGGPFSLRGHAPYASLGDYPGLGWVDTTLFSSFAKALAKDGMHVTNHSYVQSLSVYDSRAEHLDWMVRGGSTFDGNAIPARPQVWSAGNNGRLADFGSKGNDESGYFSVFTSAKNPISVGSVDSSPSALPLSPFSSLGPTLDGRIKPDVMAAGAWKSTGIGITAASVTSETSYNLRKGTSMAAPAVAGVIALMMEAYEQEQKEFPSFAPSTYKAMLVHTAIDMELGKLDAELDWDNPDTGKPVHYGPGPDYATGWGRVDAVGATRIAGATDHWREEEIGWKGDQDDWCVSLSAGDELEATLVWDDVAADPILADAVPKLVNDLDLTLVGPVGAPVLPWTLEPPPYTKGPGTLDVAKLGDAFRAADRLNNVEVADTVVAAAGKWRIRVTGHAIPLDSAQSYSLVSSHPIEACD